MAEHQPPRDECGLEPALHTVDERRRIAVVQFWEDEKNRRQTPQP